MLQQLALFFSQAFVSVEKTQIAEVVKPFVPFRSKFPLQSTVDSFLFFTAKLSLYLNLLRHAEKPKLKYEFQIPSVLVGKVVPKKSNGINSLFEQRT